MRSLLQALSRCWYTYLSTKLNGVYPRKLAFFFVYFTAISKLNARGIVEFELGTTWKETDVACVTMHNTIVILPKFGGKGPLLNFKIFHRPTTCW